MPSFTQMAEMMALVEATAGMIFLITPSVNLVVVIVAVVAVVVVVVVRGVRSGDRCYDTPLHPCP